MNWSPENSPPISRMREGQEDASEVGSLANQKRALLETDHTGTSVSDF